MLRTALEFIEKVDGLRSANAVMAAVGAALQAHGIDNYLFSFIALSTETFADVTLASQLPAGLADAYSELNYVHDDPGFRHCLTTLHPFRWFRDVPIDLQAQPRAEEVVNFCHDFGLDDGLVLPFCSSRQRMGQVWFGGKKLDLPKAAEPALHLMALYAFDRVLQLKAVRGSIPDVLSERERDILSWIAHGKTTYDVADLTGVNRRTVVDNLNRCRRKLGATTLAHAVMIAMRQRMIIP